MPFLVAQVRNLSSFSPKICEALLSADPDIVAIVQFGSSVYAPESAIDMDLLIITRQRKDYGVYLDATADFPFPIDVIPKQMDSKMGRDIAAAIKAWSRLLYGDEDIVERMVKDMPVPTYDEARILLSNADMDLQIASTTTNPILQEGRYRTAFNALFDCARLAAMAFLNTDQTRWGQLRGQLPPPFNEHFRQIIDILHVDYFYERVLPENIEAEYQRWRAIVLQFINDLEDACSD
ncbi:hypothetical protein FJZ31_34455 [Candidatus Poribacteria bacterium]|nr:hypothetical protein [Candidatus Poribacteria bacterium]